MRIRVVSSPNFSARRGGAQPDLVVLHYTAMASTGAALGRLCDPRAEVSAHYLISPAGEVLQLVEECARAWHAGSGAWGGVNDVNSRSLGIELQNTGAEPFGALQMATLERLLDEVLRRWKIPPERVIGHSDMAPGRKADPGARFDWRRLACLGLSVWPQASRVVGEHCDGAAFASAARSFGYSASSEPEVLLAAFRLRFRPWARGPLAPADLAAISDLASRFPVDREKAPT